MRGVESGSVGNIDYFDCNIEKLIFYDNGWNNGNGNGDDDGLGFYQGQALTYQYLACYTTALYLIGRASHPGPTPQSLISRQGGRPSLVVPSVPKIR